jgi:hypothetical protein
MDEYVVPEADDHSLGSCESSINDEMDDELAASTSRNDCGQSSSAESVMARETNQIEECAREDTNMLRVWRRIVTVITFCTFCAVLTGAVVFLKRDEIDTANEDVSQAMNAISRNPYRSLDSLLTVILFS